MSWLPKNCVVAPFDFSDDSLAAVDTALEMVDDASRVHVIHVLPVLSVAEPGIVWDTIDDDSRRQHAKEALLQRLTDSKYEGIDVAIAFGDPGDQITEFAQSINAQLIVLPSHGRTGLSHLLIGSVAERVVRLSHCPVLVLRA